MFVMFTILLGSLIGFAIAENDTSVNNGDEHEIVGASCGTVTPGYQDECCIDRGYSGWDSENFTCIGENVQENGGAVGGMLGAYPGEINQNNELNHSEDNKTVCPMDVKVCSDGTEVGRSGPNCEFRCPKEEDINISREKVCCEVYGYGAEMNETDIHYIITDKKACVIPENFVGGNREIVNNSYCINQIIGERQEFMDKKWEIMQERNRIKPYYINQSECPDNCSCTGSIVRCEFENGTRVMIIYAGESGNFIVQIKNINASTNVTLYKADEKVYGVFEDNETHEIILPDEVINMIKEIEKDREGRMINLSEENITLNETGYYHIDARKHARLFWIFPVKEKVGFNVNSETGEIIGIRNPWWGFLARDIHENSTSQ